MITLIFFNHKCKQLIGITFKLMNVHLPFSQDRSFFFLHDLYLNSILTYVIYKKQTKQKTKQKDKQNKIANLLSII
jgi:IS4 transposase